MKPSRVLRIVFLSIVFGCVGSAFSQSSTGSISGTVTDQNHAVVVGATVIGKNTETGFERSAVTNSSGLYRLIDIPPGPYEITIEAAGFRRMYTPASQSMSVRTPDSMQFLSWETIHVAYCATLISATS